MGIVTDIRALKTPKFSELEGYYGDSAWMFQDGFKEAKGYCENVVKNYDRYISLLEDYLPEESLDEFRKECGL